MQQNSRGGGLQLLSVGPTNPMSGSRKAPTAHLSINTYTYLLECNLSICPPYSIRPMFIQYGRMSHYTALVSS